MMSSTTTNLLVDGYVRYIEQSICKQIIPDVIRMLCFKYYLDVAKKLWLLRNEATRHPKGITITPDIDVEDLETVYINQQTANYKCKMFDAKTNSTLSVDETVGFLGSGICCKSNIIFPKNKIISQLQHKIGRDMDVMFQCDKECYAKIITEHHETKEFIGYRWNLPSLSKKHVGCTVIYSNKHGLIVIGGNEHSKQFMNVHTLSFKTEDVNNTNEWEWNNITKTEVARQHSACCIIGDDEDKLIIIGGYQYGGMTYSQSTVGRPAMKRCECYDFMSNTWISLKNARYPRQKCGYFYDKLKNKIFLCGGQDGYGYSFNKFECYDIIKNTWYRLPSTNKKHGCYPVVWYQENKNILCVTSLTGNVIECIDLREDIVDNNNKSKWNIVYNELCMELFGTTICTADLSTDRCRILKFN